MKRHEKIPRSELRRVRQAFLAAQGMEAVLLKDMSVECLGEEASPCIPGTIYWENLMKATDTGRLPTFTFGHPNRCTYCGDPATFREHVIAVSYQQTSRKQAFRLCGPMTWACRDCNSVLGNRWFDSFAKRCEWASWRLNIKAAPILWSEHQIANLDVSMKDFVRQRTMKRKWIRFRADWYLSREYYLNIENLAWQLPNDGIRTVGNAFVFAYFSETLNQIAALYKPNYSNSWDSVP